MRGSKNKVLALVALLLISAQNLARANQVEELVKKGQWNDAIEVSYQESQRAPKDVLSRVYGAYALFQKGFSTSALLWLKPLSQADWQKVPQGTERFAEILALFQKKVPLNVLPGRLDQLNVQNITSGTLRDEILFAKGRLAFEESKDSIAKQNLGAIGPRSRFYGAAHYLLGAIETKQRSYKTAAAEFSKIFSHGLLDQTTEFWSDVGAEGGSHWGASLRVEINSQALADATKIAELGVLALARSAYAEKQFEMALGHYRKIEKDSVFFKRAKIEEIWTLLALNQHEDAQKRAADLTVGDMSFESLEARTIRALVLADIGRTDEARQELALFERDYETVKSALHNFESSRLESALPTAIKHGLDQDLRLSSLRRYHAGLLEERNSLVKDENGLFRSFATFAGQLEPLILESRGAIDRVIRQHVERRKADLENLFTQSKLISIETFLEDREKLRSEFEASVAEDQDLQRQHDEKLAELLHKAVEVSRETIPRFPKRKLSLSFRQAELLWDLSSARGILAQSTKDFKEKKRQEEASDRYQRESIQIVQSIVKEHPTFEAHSKAMFFLGYALTETGHENAGINMLASFVHKYPRDAFAPDAYRILADFKFDGNQFRAAETLYRKILEFPESPIVGYALYKIGWCAYNLKDFGRALLGLEKAVLWAANAARVSNLLSLKTESKRDIISFYAEVGDHRKAFDYFGKFLQGSVTDWIDDLARELDRIGQFEKSMDLYKALMIAEPGTVANIARQAAIINGEYKLRRWPNLVLAAQKLVEAYKAALEEPKTDDKEPSFIAEKILREAVLAQLFEYRRAPSADAMKRVQELDELYLEAFGKWPSSQEPLYRHAIFLSEQKQYKEAARAFGEHWTRFHSQLEEPKKEESLRNWIHALDKSNDTPEKDHAPKLAADILRVTEQYASIYPDTKHTRSILFLRSAVLLKNDRIEDGMELSQKLFDADPADEIGKGAFKNLRVALYDLKEWKRAYEWASELAVRENTAVKIYANEIRAVREETLFLWAGELKDDRESAAVFLKVSEDPTMIRLKEKALYNAFVRLEKASAAKEALVAAERLEKFAPQSELLRKIAGVRAAFYQEAGDYSRALPLFRVFISTPDEKTPKDALALAEFNMGLIEESLGNHQNALKSYRDYLASSEDKKSKRALEAERGIARINRPKEPSSPMLAKDKSTLAALLGKSYEFEKAPIPKSGDLASRIKKGGETLESTAKRFVDLSSDSSTVASVAFEAYCSLPFLYEAYAKAIQSLGADDKKLKPQERDELSKELRKISEPIEAKAQVLATQCIQRSWEAQHDGAKYRAVLDRWGWRADQKRAQLVDSFLKRAREYWPFLDDTDHEGTETQILEDHLEKKASEESWFALARHRWNPKQLGRSRLTLVDASLKYPKSGKILNALASIEELTATSVANLDLFRRATAHGSAAAHGNLAVLHLSAGRLDLGLDALRKAESDGLFEKRPELLAITKELTEK